MQPDRMLSSGGALTLVLDTGATQLFYSLLAVDTGATQLLQLLLATLLSYFRLSRYESKKDAAKS
jgi:hypothetical protein